MDFLLDILPKYDMITKSCSGRKLHMGEFPSGQRGQTVNLLLIASVVRIHLPPPAKDPPAKLVGLLLVRKDSWIRTHSNPTCRWHVGKTSANTGFLLTAFHRKAGNRIHLPRTAPPASLVGLLLVGKIRGFEPTQIQHAGGMLAKPVQTLVFSLPLSIGKRAIESRYPSITFCISEIVRQSRLNFLMQIFLPDTVVADRDFFHTIPRPQITQQQNTGHQCISSN